jgi:hypothetical protein
VLVGADSRSPEHAPAPFTELEGLRPVRDKANLVNEGT